MLQISGNKLQLVEKFKYLQQRWYLRGNGRRYKEIDTRIGKANAVLAFLREFYRTIVTKRKLQTRDGVSRRGLGLETHFASLSLQDYRLR